MSSPVPPSGDAAARARTGSAWWSARAELAQRRTHRFAVRWSLGVGALVVAASLAPLASGDPAAASRIDLERFAADTLRSAQRARAAEAAVTAAESALAVARALPARLAVPPQATVPASHPPAPVPTAGLSPALADLTQRIAEARRLRTASAYLEVAAHPEVGSGPRMRAMADSVRAVQALSASTPGGPDDADRSRQLTRFGVSIIAMAQFRRDALVLASGGTRDSAGNVSVSSTAPVAAPSVPAVTPRDVIREPARDTIPLVTALAVARDTLARALRVHDSLTAVIRARDDAATPAARSLFQRLIPAAALLLLLVAGLVLRFVVALRAELDAPTLANAAEAERLTGARALTTVRDALLDGPARFKPSGVDPFRMLYLGLTATGTRARTAIVTGPDLEIAAATGARLAIAAAADHRNTLIVDLDPASIAVSRTFRERAEPGLRDVLARAFTWREVARPVGSSDGLPITLLPAGTERDDESTGEARAALLVDFERLRSAFELTLAVTPLGSSDLALALLPASPVVVTAVAGETPIDALIAAVDAQRAAGRKVAGLVIWDAPRPILPTRGELAAELSKRKGRTPGGSFEAVRKAIDPRNSGNKRP